MPDGALAVRCPVCEAGIGKKCRYVRPNPIRKVKLETSDRLLLRPHRRREKAAQFNGLMQEGTPKLEFVNVKSERTFERELNKIRRIMADGNTEQR